MNSVMEVEKRETKLKRHEKEKPTLLKNNNKRIRPTSFNVTGVSKFFLPEKRARRNARIPKFLLGGNISDPLNLNSLQVMSTFIFVLIEHFNMLTFQNESETNNDDDPVENQEDNENENKVELIIPPNINDPLNLLSPVDKTE